MKDITQALINFHRNLPELKKDSSVKYGTTNFAYASLDTIMKAIRKPLADNGLAFYQTATPDGSEMITCLMHVSGEQIESRVPMAQDTSTGRSGPQAQGSALTYARRYGLCVALGLVADEDDDGQTAAAAPAKPAPQADSRPWVNRTDKAGSITPEWKALVQHIKAGKGTIEDITTKRRINKTDLAELLKDVNS